MSSALSVVDSPPARYAEQPHPASPYLELSVPTAVRRLRALAEALPGTAIHYAVKANPQPELLAALHAAGGRFDVASPAEVTAALAAGAAPEDLVYSNPVKRRADVAFAAAHGVRLFVVDSPEETVKVAAAAPDAAVLCRLVTSGAGSDWPLSRKYGCSTDEAIRILVAAAALGLEPAGVSFHVGSQQRDPEAWAAPVAAAARVFAALRAEGLQPWLLDLGGGFPARLAEEEGDDDCPPLAAYGAAIDRHLQHSFGADRPQTLVEPGRAVVAEAGVLHSRVLATLTRGGVRWVFLDAGVFTGLVETLDEAIRYPIRTSRDGGPIGPCVLAGPTCDSADVLYEQVMVRLPLDLAEGDWVHLDSAGAYTSCYSTVGFNGFPPLPTLLRD
ncbi:type III PLP-dependent enzyme [Nocardioides sp.]|uniref:type III PLP-dependent enzyme n=1 Tax=Nocardioides sp. TaxID=35761 RepID=UPI0037842E39